jgi:hypothetical protein
MPVAAQVIEMAGGSDAAKRLILTELLPVVREAGLEAVGHDVLVAVYSRAGAKTAGGIIIADNYREDEFQGKVGLILSLGPMCCDKHTDGLWSDWFGGRPPGVGDWVVMRPADTNAMLIKQRTCRTLEWKYIRARVDAPDKVM